MCGMHTINGFANVVLLMKVHAQLHTHVMFLLQNNGHTTSWRHIFYSVE